jgi:hypothetical protein
MEPFLSGEPSCSCLDPPPLHSSQPRTVAASAHRPIWTVGSHPGKLRVFHSPAVRPAPQRGRGELAGLPRSSGSDDAARGSTVHRACRPVTFDSRQEVPTQMSVVADYPFLNIMWSMFIFFAWVIFIYLLILVLADNFRRTDHSGWAKAGWTLFVIFVPLIGVLVYMIARPSVDMSVV